MRNSSPPIRARVSLARRWPLQAPAAAVSSRSPSGWPWRSLNCLKWSRSMIATTRRPPRLARASSRSRSRWSARRLGSPVSWSVWACSSSRRTNSARSMPIAASVASSVITFRVCGSMPMRASAQTTISTPIALSSLTNGSNSTEPAPAASRRGRNGGGQPTRSGLKIRSWPNSTTFADASPVVACLPWSDGSVAAVTTSEPPTDSIIRAALAPAISTTAAQTSGRASSATSRRRAISDTAWSWLVLSRICRSSRLRSSMSTAWVMKRRGLLWSPRTSFPCRLTQTGSPSGLT